MRSQPADVTGRQRSFGGEVNTNGTVLNGGVDFTVTKGNTGSYNIRYVRPFAAVPGVTVVPEDQQGFWYITAGTLTTTGFTLTFSQTIGGAGVDMRFSFVATGRQ
jgi:hypothetical protein